MKKILIFLPLLFFSCNSIEPIEFGKKYFVENLDKSRGCGDCDEYWVMEFNNESTGTVYSTPNPFGDIKSCTREFSYERRGHSDFIIHVLEDTVLKLSSSAFRNSISYYHNTCEDEIFGNTYTLGDGLVNVKHYGYVPTYFLENHKNETYSESLKEGSLFGLTVKLGESLPKDSLRLKRNEIFARKGYEFNSNDLKAYFSSKPWYKEKGKNVKLTEREKYIVNAIKKLEELDLTVYDVQFSANDTVIFLRDTEASTLYFIKDKHLFTLPIVYNLAGDKYPYLTTQGKIKLTSNGWSILLEDLGCVRGINIEEAFDDYPYGPRLSAEIGDLSVRQNPLDTNNFIELGPGLGLSSLYDNVITVSRLLEKNYGLYARREADLTYDCEDCTAQMSEQSYFNYSKNNGEFRGYHNDGYATFRRSSRSSYKGISKVEQKFFAACYFGETTVTTLYGDKLIPDILKGDVLITPDSTAIVDSVVSVFHDNLIKVTFDNTTELILTPDHPLVSCEGTIVSFDPEVTNMLYENINTCEKITLGTSFKDINGNSRTIINITPFQGAHKTYTIFSDKEYIYYINGIPTIPEHFKNKDKMYLLNS